MLAMSQTASSLPQRPDRQRILDLAKDLIDDLEAIALNEIDGEFYWRICRDDLLGPLSQLAESIAPHIVDPARRNEQLDEAQRQVIDEVRQKLDEFDGPGFDDDARDSARDWFMKDLKARELFAVGRSFADQLPRFVRQHYSGRRRIPMRAPMTITPLGQGITLAIRIWSRSVTGNDLEAFIWSDHPPNPYVAPYNVPDSSPVSPEVDDRITQDIEPRPISQASLQIHFDLVTTLPASLAAEPPSQREEPPFIQITVRLPFPPRGVIGPAYDAIVRKQHQWHLQLLGGESRQEKTTAIWTWATGLLVASGEDFYDARWEVENQTSMHPPSRPPSRAWFEKSRTKLIERVPEANDYLYRRRRPKSRGAD
jgi:hypothetical protein